MERSEELGDDELLRAAGEGDGAAFAVFYERHLAVVVAFVCRRAGSAEQAADLTAEVFAAALLACQRYRAGEAPAVLWLLGIARNKLRDSARRSSRQADARRRLGMQEIPFSEDDLAGVEELAGDGSKLLGQLEDLPDEQRVAVWGRVVEEKDYKALARELDCSEALARQRVSRGLRRLRARLEENR